MISGLTEINEICDSGDILEDLSKSIIVVHLVKPGANEWKLYQ